MRKRAKAAILTLCLAGTLLVGPAAPASATTCSEPANVDCTIWEGVICNEGVPKAIRVKAGCFSNQP